MSKKQQKILNSFSMKFADKVFIILNLYINIIYIIYNPTLYEKK